MHSFSSPVFHNKKKKERKQTEIKGFYRSWTVKSSSSIPKASLASMQFFLTSWIYLVTREKEISINQPFVIFFNKVPLNSIPSQAWPLQQNLTWCMLSHSDPESPCSTYRRWHLDCTWTRCLPIVDLSRDFTPQYSCSCLCRRGSGIVQVHEGLWDE